MTGAQDSRSQGAVEAPRFLLSVEFGMLLLAEGVASLLAFALGSYLGDLVGSGTAARWGGGTVLLVCYGLGRTVMTVRYLGKKYRGEIPEHAVIYLLHGFRRTTLNAAVSDGRGEPEQPGPVSSTISPRLLAVVGLGLPLLVVATLSVSGNPYLVFLIPIAAAGVLYGVRRAGPGPVRPWPYHVGLSLTVTYSFLPLILAFLIGFSGIVLPALPASLPYTVWYHFTYSPLHVVLVPLASLTVVYASSSCLLLAYDVHRARRGVLPKILSEDAEARAAPPDPDHDRRTGH